MKKSEKTDSLPQVAMEYSENKKTADVSRNSEETYRSFFENNPAVMLIIAPDTGAILEANSAAVTYYGYSLERLLTMRIMEINMSPPEQVKTALDQVRSGECRHFYFRHRLANGEIRDVEVHSGLIPTRGQDLLFSIIHDISDRSRAEKELKEKQQELTIRSRIDAIFLTVSDDEMYARVLEVILDVMKSQYGTFGYFDEGGSFVAPALSRTIYWEKCNVPDKEILFQKGTFSGVWGKAILTKKTVIDNKGPFRTPLGHIPIVNTIVTPVLFRGKLISTIHLANKSGGYDDDDRQRLESIAEDLAPILQARLERDRHEKERVRLEDTQLFLLQCGHDGMDFFESLAYYLSGSLEMEFVCIDRLLPDGLMARTVAIYFDGKFDDNITYALKDTPCGDVVGKTVCCFPHDVCGLFPRDEVLSQMKAESYVGVTLWSSKGQPIGLIAVIGRSPLLNPKLAESILKLVAVRAASEMERRQAKEALRESEAKYRALFQHAPQGIIVVEIETRAINYANPAACRMFGYSAEEEMARLRINQIHPQESLQLVLHEFDLLSLSEKSTASDLPCLRKDGTIFYADVSAASVVINGKKMMIGFFNDITERRQADADLKNSLKEKEVLLKELYHRTKNNMQVIIALLELQSGGLEDPRAIEIFGETKNKIKSMSLVHQKLYQSRNLSMLDLGEYVAELLPLLFESHRRQVGSIGLRTELESVMISIDSAVPCGLILNELISNALKHAFPDQRSGEIRVSVRSYGEDQEGIEMEVADNGVGLPAGLEFRDSESVGFQSVLLLTEHQLRGKVKVKTGNGVKFQIRFEESKRKNRV